MIYGYNDKGVPLLKANRALKVKDVVYRIFISGLFSVILVSTVPAGAFETTKASALALEDVRAQNPLSFQESPPLSAKADPCLSLLHARRLSPGGSAQSLGWRPASDSAAVPVALGLFLGVRIALGPKEVVKPAAGRVQIGPEFRAASSDGNDNYALAIASYRGCKNNLALDLNNNKKNGNRE